MSANADNLVTKGDMMEDPDPWSVSMSKVNGVYLFKIPYAGYLSNFIRTKVGWFLIIAMPAMLLLSLIVIEIIKETKKLKTQFAAIKQQANNESGYYEIQDMNYPITRL
jgi:signal peptidase